MAYYFLLALDLGGTFVFAISGALAAVRYRLDAFGVMVLAFAAGNAGGMTRDLLIGAVPPAAIANSSYILVSVAAGLLVYYGHQRIERFDQPVLWLDAVGLAFFAVAGAEKALEFGLSPVAAALLGMLTGIGGGMLRDLLVREIPTVLRADFYALAALAGASVVVGAHALALDPALGAIAGGLSCFLLRTMAIRHGWHLPRALRVRGAAERPPKAPPQHDQPRDPSRGGG